MKNFFRRNTLILISIAISAIFLLIEIDHDLFLNKGVEDSVVGQIFVAGSYFFAQAVLIIMLIYATVFNMKYYSTKIQRTTKGTLGMVLSWAIEFLAVLYFITANFTSINYYQPLLIIGLVLLCIGLKYYNNTKNYLAKAMVFWGISIIIFLCISDIFLILLSPADPEWIYF